MKQKRKLTALLTCILMLGSTCTALPAFCEEAPADAVSAAEPADDPALTAFLSRIAEWEDASLTDCLLLQSDNPITDMKFLTPTKLYSISDFLGYRFYLSEGTVLNPDAVLQRWRGMLEEAGCPETIMQRVTTCPLVESSEGGYFIETEIKSYGDLSIADCLQTFPQVTRIETKHSYHTDSRPNTSMWYELWVQTDPARTLTAADFPALEGVQAAETSHFHPNKEPGTWILTLPEDTYADYYAAAVSLQSLDFVDSFYLNAASTLLADDSPDATSDPDWQTVYERGIPTYPVFGDHTGYGDPLYGYYIYDGAEMPTDKPVYFTGQVFLYSQYVYSSDKFYDFTDGHQVVHWNDSTLTVQYSDWDGGYFYYREEEPLSIAEAQALCEDMKASFTADETPFSSDPSLVYCKKMPCTVPGDLTGDDQVNITDAKYLLEWSTRWSAALASYQAVPLLQTLPTADVNGDGTADITDAKCILNYSVYQLAFGEAPAWSDVT